jgi:hypothetical protein
MPAFPLIPVLAGASIFGSGALLGGKANQNKNRMAGNNPLEQSQRLLGLQQARDERAKAQRLTEDDYKFLSQLEKDRLQRTMKGVDTRQRIATRGTLIQQGQLGNQILAQEALRNRGAVMAAGAGSTFA